MKEKQPWQKKKLTVGTKHRNSQWPIKPKEKAKLFLYFRGFTLPFRSCLLNLKNLLWMIYHNGVKYKITSPHMGFHSVTSFIFKEHIREILSLESQSEAPSEQDIWKHLKFLIRETTIWN